MLFVFEDDPALPEEVRESLRHHAYLDQAQRPRRKVTVHPKSVPRYQAWDFTEALPIPGKTEEMWNPWRKAHTEHYWVYYTEDIKWGSESTSA